MCKSMGDESTRPSVPLSVFHTAAGGTRIYRGRKLVFVKFKPSQEVAYAGGTNKQTTTTTSLFSRRFIFTCFFFFFSLSFRPSPPPSSSFFCLLQCQGSLCEQTNNFRFVVRTSVPYIWLSEKKRDFLCPFCGTF